MAVIQYSGLVAGMQGKINGSVLSRGRAGNVIYNRPKQRLEPTNSQLETRGSFSAIAAFWRELTPGQREDWAAIADLNPVPNRFGDPQILSGYAYFMRMLQLGSPTIPPAALVPDLVPDSVYEFTPLDSELTMELTNEGFLITDLVATADTLNDSAAVNAWNIYISLPIGDFGPPYFRTWYLIGQGTFAANLGAAFELSYEVASKVMPNGFRAFNGSKHYLKAVNYIQNQGGVSVEQIWDIEVAVFPPVDFPVFSFPTDEINLIYFWYASDPGLFNIRLFAIDTPEIEADFSWEMQFAPSQTTQAPVDEGDWGDFINTGIVVDVPGEIFRPTNPPTAELWKPVYDIEFPASADSPTGYWIPIRGRLVKIDTGQRGPWVIGYSPVYAF